MATAKRSDRLAWISTLGSAALCLLAFFGLSKWSEYYKAPQCAAVSADAVWMYSQGSLWRLTHRGEVVGVYNGSALGVGTIVDTLVALDDAQLIVRGHRAGEWRYCRVGDKGASEAACRALFGGDEAGRTVHEAAIAVAPDGARWIFADFQTGEILLLNSQRQVLTKGKGLTSPNGGVAVWLPDQTIGLFSSDRWTLYSASVEGDRIAPLESRWSLQSDGKPAGGYVWSAAFDPERRTWWLADGSVRRKDRANLWQADDAGVKAKSLALDPQGQAVQIVMLDSDSALIPDVVAGRVHRIDLASGNMDDFGDERFRSAIECGQERFDHITQAAFCAVVGIFVLPLIIGCFFVWRDSKRDLGACPHPPLPEPAAFEGEFWFGCGSFGTTIQAPGGNILGS